jgi:hypothetical protein
MNVPDITKVTLKMPQALLSNLEFSFVVFLMKKNSNKT